MKKFFALMFAAVFLFTGCGNNASEKSTAPKTEKQVEQQTETKAVSETPQWNTSDLNPETNGNIQTATRLLNANPNLQSIAVDADAADVMRRPWDYYGQVIRFTGYAALLQDQPPGSDLSRALGGEACEIVMTAEDSATIVDGILRGNTKGLYEGDYTEFYGYPCGIMEVPNKIGGKFSHLLVIGTR